MTNHLLETVMPSLESDARIASVEADGEDLIVHIDGALLRMALDREHGRTACWAEVRKLLSDEIDGGATAALRYNATLRAATALSMGLYLPGNSLTLGKSVDADAITAEAAIDVALKVGGGLEEARTLLDDVLDGADRQENPQPNAQEDEFLMRV